MPDVSSESGSARPGGSRRRRRMVDLHSHNWKVNQSSEAVAFGRRCKFGSNRLLLLQPS
jgi:hypothetical protein